MLSNKSKAIGFILLSAFGFAMMSMFVRLAGDLPSIQKSFFRNVVAMVVRQNDVDIGAFVYQNIVDNVIEEIARAHAGIDHGRAILVFNDPDLAEFIVAHNGQARLDGLLGVSQGRVLGVVRRTAPRLLDF